MNNKQIVNQAFGSVTIGPNQSGVCMIEPPRTPFFEPKRCKIICLNLDDPRESLDLKIGAVTIGGSPQLAINTLTPMSDSNGIRPSDIDIVDWSVFSTAGLAREVQFSLYNPNDKRVAVFIYVEGLDVPDLFTYENDGRVLDENEIDAERAKRIHEWDTAYAKAGEPNAAMRQNTSTKEIEIEPFGQRVLPVEMAVSPFFKPHRVRFHGHRLDDGKEVPFSIIDAFCGSKILYGAMMVSDLFAQQSVLPRNFVERETPQMLMRRLSEMVDTLSTYGPGVFQKEQDERLLPLQTFQDPRGMLTSHLVEDNGWCDASWWPIGSTAGLRREIGIVAYNPWPFSIRTSVSMEGQCLSSLDGCRSVDDKEFRREENEGKPLDASEV